MITRRERAAAAPGIVPKPSKTRRWLIENIPYYDRIDGPLSRINFLKVLPWVVVIALILFLLLNVVGGKKDSANNANNISPTTSAVTSVSTTSALFGDATPGATVSTGSKNAPTPTLSNIVPTATPAPTPTATAKPAATQARVVGAPDGVNMRKDPGLTGQVLKKIAPGKVVTIRSAEFKTIDGGIWWPVNYEGQDGWILSSFLEKINP